MKKGFTLAEVLITLGVIGVVAAMTMPVLIQNHRKHVVETRLKKFYSVINSAFKLSEVENSEIGNWDYSELKAFDGETLYNWYLKYLNPYFNNKEVQKASDGIFVKLSDGSAFMMYNSGNGVASLHIVYCIDVKSCKDALSNHENKVYDLNLDGKNTFFFGVLAKKGVIPYKPPLSVRETDPTIEKYLHSTVSGYLAFGCADAKKYYCAALIEQNGWKIPKEYPIKF